MTFPWLPSVNVLHFLSISIGLILTEWVKTTSLMSLIRFSRNYVKVVSIYCDTTSPYEIWMSFVRFSRNYVKLSSINIVIIPHFT